MKRIQFSVRYPGRFVHPLQRRVVEDASITRGELLTWSPTEDATTLLWCDGDREAIEAAVAAVDSLLETEIVEGADGTYAFVRQADYEFPDALLGAIADARVAFLPPVAFLETGAVRFEAVGSAAALGAFHEELAAVGDLAIERVREFERRRSPPRLTERQRAALEAALAVGYYEVPREGSVADVAAALECSSSTAGELLRKAEATVISDYTRGRPNRRGRGSLE